MTKELEPLAEASTLESTQTDTRDPTQRFGVAIYLGSGFET
ncbi:MAG: hypothetical protein U5J63_15800 [Fodinibius sp.]|nr:hypothetical protein [Fodinibius sp.]